MTAAGKERMRRAGAAIVAVAALAALYAGAVRLTGTMPRCLFKWITGWSCPGCGSQRAFMALLGGDIHAAVRFNLLLPVAVLYLALLLAGYLFPSVPALARTVRAATSPAALWTWLAVVILWTVARNIAGI